jgi:hypothetical protein
MEFLGIRLDIPAEEFVQNCAHCAVQVGGRRQEHESQVDLGWMQRLRGRGKTLQYEVEARPQAWKTMWALHQRQNPRRLWRNEQVIPDLAVITFQC